MVSAVGRLDDRAVAVKKVHFKSAVPPWAKNDALEGLHEELLREARALALMENPNVVKYHTAWIEPRWSKLAAVGATTNRNGRRVGAGASKTALSPGALARRDSFIVADDGGSDSDYSDEYSEGASDYSESGSITGGGSARCCVCRGRRGARQDLPPHLREVAGQMHATAGCSGGMFGLPRPEENRSHARRRIEARRRRRQRRGSRRRRSGSWGAHSAASRLPGNGTPSSPTSI